MGPAETPGHNAGKGGYFLETEQQWNAASLTKPWPDAMKVPLPPLREPRAQGAAQLRALVFLRGARRRI